MAAIRALKTHAVVRNSPKKQKRGSIGGNRTLASSSSSKSLARIARVIILLQDPQRPLEKIYEQS